MKFGPLMVTLKKTTVAASNDEMQEKIRAEAERKIIQHPLVGGIILFAYNYKNKAQLSKLTQEIKQLAKEANKEIFITIDHEGGFVQRLDRGGFHAMPAAKVLGDFYRIDNKAGLTYAEKLGNDVATELKGAGIDLLLGPVLDLDKGNIVISGLDRSYSANPHEVAAIAQAFVTGLARGGMRATLKHFPGHGENIGDSHEVKPVDKRSLEEIRNNDLIPFQRLIATGEIGAIMSAHITYTQVDAEHTAGTSEKWLVEILRQELNFQGVIISDCLTMNGAGDNADLAKTLEALKYGDVALLCHKTPTEYLDLLKNLDTRHLNLEKNSARIERWLSPVIRHREIDMKAHQIGIHRPPVLHGYHTRLQKKYRSLTAQTGDNVEPYDSTIKLRAS